MTGIEGIIRWSLMASSVMILVILVRQLLQGKIKQTWQYGLWLIVLVRLLVPQLPASSLSFFNVFHFYTQEMSKGGTGLDGEVYLEKMNDVQQGEDAKAVFEHVLYAGEELPEIVPSEGELGRRSRIPIPDVLWGVWAIGGLSVLSYFVRGYQRIKKRLVGARAIDNQEILQMEKVVRQKLGVKKQLRLVEGEMPMVFGLLKPIICLPQGYSEEELEMMLTHEYMHYKYKDHWMTYMQILALALHWFNPLVWLSMQGMKKDMELACDERVITSGVSRKRYASTLLKLTVHTKGQAYLLQGMGEKQKAIKQRVLHVANFKPKKVWISALGIGMITVLAAGCLTNAKMEEVLTHSIINESKDVGKVLIPSIALLGIDQDGMRTDAIMVVSANGQTGQIQITSVPRDTKIEWDEEQKALLSGQAPEKSKLSEMTAYGGLGNIQALTLKELEEILELSIPYYAVVDMKSVEQFIDSIGGIMADIPKDMNYTDTAQGLEINLSKGHQLLDGKQAMDFMRYRRYPEGDGERIKIQQQVVRSLAEQLMGSDDKEEVLSSIMNVAKEVQTNIELKDIPLYWKSVWGLDLSQIEYTIVPGEARYEEGRSYFIVDVNGGI